MVVVTEPVLRTGTLLHHDALVSVVLFDDGEVHTVPSRNVFTPGGLSYAEEWAGKTGSTIYDVYIPDSLKVS